ncbi:hypothetical protein A2U01_0018694 [Trifolium medium]|uniref:Uncharacterized protein n=1 Tax=Trifolium medium TaxID=97028 RepID=A0A392NF64_9FABA|nr:hypothetical protein [Trifolium medium]
MANSSCRRYLPVSARVLILFCVNPGSIQEITEPTVKSVMLGVVTCDVESKFHESLNLELLLQVSELMIMSGTLNRVGTVRSTTGYGVWYCMPRIVTRLCDGA